MPTDDVLVDLDAEGSGDAQRNSRAAKTGISALQLDDGPDEFL
jgi:hypothetical protein